MMKNSHLPLGENVNILKTFNASLKCKITNLTLSIKMDRQQFYQDSRDRSLLAEVQCSWTIKVGLEEERMNLVLCEMITWEVKQ